MILTEVLAFSDPTYKNYNKYAYTHTYKIILYYKLIKPPKVLFMETFPKQNHLVGLFFLTMKFFHSFPKIAICKAFWFDVAQGRINGACETWTHSWRFANLRCPVHFIV